MREEGYRDMSSMPPDLMYGPGEEPPGDNAAAGHRPRRILGMVGVGVLVAAVVAAVVGISEAGGSSGPAGIVPAVAATSPTAPSAAARPYAHRPGRFGPLGFGALHGQFVVPKAGGGYQSVAVQRGKVTAVSGTSITLKSGDGFTRTYAVTGSTIVVAERAGIGAVKNGDQAWVSATVGGDKASASRVVDLSQFKQLRKEWPRACRAGARAMCRHHLGKVFPHR